MDKKEEPRYYENVLLYQQGEWIKPQQEPNDWTSRLADILLSENLVVLTGLGTSLCLNTGGDVIAPKMEHLWKNVTKLKAFNEVTEKVGYDAKLEDVEALLSHCQLYLTLNSDADEVKTFVMAAEDEIHQLCSFPKDGTELPSHEAFLRKVARRSIRQPRMKLFTTNYDLVFERAASRAGFVTIDGFGHTPPHAFNGIFFGYDLVRRELEGEVPNFIPNVFQFYKIHGSVDWVFNDEGEVLRGNGGKRAMIFPRYGKFESSYQQPYFEMMARLQASLRQPNTGLLLLGYGCKDKHINEPLLSALRGNVGLKCALVDPALEKDEANDVHDRCRSLIDGGDTRLLMISAKFEDFVRHIPDLVAATEQEEHLARTRKAR